MNRVLLSFCLTCVFFLGHRNHAQEIPIEIPTNPSSPDRELMPLPENETSEATGLPEPEIVRTERSIYVPFEDLEKMFEKEGRGVFLPYREFLELWNALTLERKKDKEKPPTDGVISSAKYTATVEGDKNRVLAIEAIIQAESFKEEGWAVVPLAKSGLNIAEADTGDATLHLGAKGYELILPKKGQYEIRMRLYAKVTRDAGKSVVSMNLPRAGVSRFQASIPEQGWDFELKPAAAYSTENIGEDTRLSFFFGEKENFNLTWQKQGEETKLTPLLFVESDTASTVVPGALETTLTLNYRILRSGVDQFDITVPKGQEILSVDGANIKEWDVVEMDNTQKLAVTLHSPAKKEYALTLTLEQALDSLPTEVSLPRIVAENVVRQRGSLLVRNSPELELGTVSTEGLTQQSLANRNSGFNAIDMGNANAAPQQGIIRPTINPYARFRYLTLPFDLTLSIKKAEPLIEVESWTRFSVEPDSAKFLARFDYEIKRAGIFETKIEFPADFTGIEATGDQVKDFSEETADGKRILTVTFKNRVQGKISFNVTGRRVRENAGDDTEVPVFSPVDVERHDGKIGLSIHTSLDPRTGEAGDLRQQDVSLLGSKIPGSGAMQIGFRYRGTAAPAVVSYTLKKPQISGEVLTLVEVREQIIRYQWTIAWNVRYAGVDTFVISVPQDIAADLRHEGALIKEVDKNYTADGLTAPNGSVFWAIVLRDKKLGAYQLKLTLDRNIATLAAEADDAAEENDDSAGRDFQVSLPEIQLHQVQTETGQIAVIKDDSLEILKANTTSLESIDPKELSSKLARPGVFLSYKYRRHPLSLDLDVSRNEFLPVPQAVVTHADLTSVLSADAAITTEVIYWVKNNAKQFFSVDLPEGGKMVSDIYVKGQPQQPMRRANKDVVLIRLPVDQTNAQFPVRFIYEVPSPHAGKKLGPLGSVKIDTAVLTDAEILQTRLKLYLPDGYSYRKFKSSMSLPLGERGWTRFRNIFDRIVPVLGPQIPLTRRNLWKEPPTLAANQQGGFDLDIPTGGHLYHLHRLDEPSPVTVVYRGKGFQLFVESVAGLLTFLGAIMMLLRPLKQRFFYFAAFGILPLIIAGAVSPTSSSFWTALYLGTLVGSLVWLAKGLPKFIKYLWGLLVVPFGWLAGKMAERKKRNAEKESAEKKKKKTEAESDSDKDGDGEKEEK